MSEMPFLDQAGHERIARAAVQQNPDLVQIARSRKNFIPLIRKAQQLSDAESSEYWLAQRIGQLVRGEG